MTHRTNKNPQVLVGGWGLDALAAEAVVCHCDVSDGCDSTTHIRKDAISYQFGTDSPSIRRPQGGLAVAVIRAHPGQNCIPSAPNESRGQAIPGKWTRWGLSECHGGEPIRAMVMDGLPLRNQLTMRVSPRLSLEGVLP